MDYVAAKEAALLASLTTSFVIALGGTLLWEAATYRFLFFRKTRMIELCLVNLITNPIAQWVVYVAAEQANLTIKLGAILGVEIAVILAEWALFKALKFERPLLLSVVLNISSFIVGLTLQSILA